MERIPFYSLEPQHRQLRMSLGNRFDEVLNGNWFVLGEQLRTFEREFASYHQMRFCAGVGNGFDAIYISLRALDLGPGDEVLVPAHTYVATWLAVSRTGASPAPVDVCQNSWLIDPIKLESAITSKTKAIVPVHLYGMPCHMEKIIAIAKKYSLKIVEDCAQSCGASLGDRKTGSFGHCNAFSFYPTKNLGALGDGGAILTNDEAVYEQICRLRNYGQKKNTKVK